VRTAAVLVVALLFIAVLGALTVSDLIRNGITPLSVVAIAVLVLFMIGIVGALRQPPSE
jgi:hypothetical protein